MVSAIPLYMYINHNDRWQLLSCAGHAMVDFIVNGTKRLLYLVQSCMLSVLLSSDFWLGLGSAIIDCRLVSNV